MGKRHKARTGGASKAVEILERKQRSNQVVKYHSNVDSDEENDEYEDNTFIDKKGNIFFNQKSENSDEDDDEEEVFSLEQADNDIDYDEENSDDEVQGDLGELINTLDPKLRNKILNKTIEDDSDDEMNVSFKKKSLDKFGQKKKDYYDGDLINMDDEEGFEDAEDEEQAAKDLMKEKLSRMKAKDYFDTVGDEDIEVDDADADADADDIRKFIKKNSTKNGRKHDKLIGDLELIALGAGHQENIQVEDMNRDFSLLSTDQKIQIIKKESPEVEDILKDLNEKAVELQEKIAPLNEIIQEIAQLGPIDDEIVEYLQVKHQLLLSYCTNIVFYLYMKSLGMSVRDHPVMKQLLELRYCMEKLRPIDGKLKHQIDRLVNLKSLDKEDMKNALLRPNLDSLIDNDDDDKQKTNKSQKKNSSKSVDRKKRTKAKDDIEDESIASSEFEEDSIDNKSANDDELSDDNDDGDDTENSEDDLRPKKSNIYKAPKMVATHYDDDERKAEKQERKLEMKRNKLRNSEILQSLQEQLGHEPETLSSSGAGLESAAQNDLQLELDERRNFEEDRFIRLTMTRKEKQSIKRKRQEAEKLENLESIGDIGEFEELADLVKTTEEQLRSKSAAALKSLSGEASGDISKKQLTMSMQRTLNSISQKQLKTKLKSTDETDDALFEVRSKTIRRPAPVDSMNDEDFTEEAMLPTKKSNPKKDGLIDHNEDDMNLLDVFTKKKREFLSRKEAHYTAEPKYGGYEEQVTDGDKRAATYEMITNKGLTPHRNKINRNARVKKRVKYDQAKIRRKGAVREVRVGEAAAYAGEQTGIKADVSRSRKF